MEDKTSTTQISKSKSIDIIAIALAIISLCALGVSIIQTKIAVDEQRLATKVAKAELWPRLSATFEGRYSEKGLESFTFYIENVGTGPAIIENMEIKYLGEVFSDWSELFFHISNLDISYFFNYEGLKLRASDPSNEVIKVGEKRPLYGFKAEDIQPFKKFLRIHQSDSIPSIKLCYKSVFDDYWKIEGKLNSGLLPQESKVACQ